jgi:hypothetical protein
MNVRLDSLEHRRENEYRHPHPCIIVTFDYHSDFHKLESCSREL